MMDVERGQLLFSGRGFRTLGQLILEWIVGLIAVEQARQGRQPEP
ncbi:MAG: hypothetical protein QXJ55_06840 [Candidatus Caldarchaeum sp.]